MCNNERPDIRFVGLAYQVFSPAEKEQLLFDLLIDAIRCVHTHNIEPLKQTLLSWEYTALCKKDPTFLEQQKEY